MPELLKLVDTVIRFAQAGIDGWLADAESHPRRAPIIARLRAAGVLHLPGAEAGW
jgi:hypothetical protein